MRKYNCCIDKFASPEYRLPIVNSNSVYIPEKDLIACVNYSNCGDTRLYLADLKNSSAKAISFPEGEYGIYGMEKGNDGKLYCGSATGKLHSYDIDKNEFTFICRIFENRLTWGAGASRRYNRIYIGVYPTGEFYEYNPETKKCKVFKTVNLEKGCYARYFRELHDGSILIMTTGAKYAWSVFNPATEELKSFEIPEKKAHDKRPVGRNVILLDDERFLYSSKKAVCCFNWRLGKNEEDYLECSEPFMFIFEYNKKFFGMNMDEKIYEFDKKGATPVMDAFPEGNRPMNIHIASDNSLIAVGDNGLVMNFDFESGIKKSFRVPNTTTKGLVLHSLKKHPEKNIVVGSQFINTQIFTLDLKTGKSVSSLHKIYSRSGQINCSEVVNGKYYLGIYGGAFIAEYDHEKDFIFGENPKVIAKVGEEQNRPVAMAVNNGQIFMTTKANYSALGGAISVFDPKTYKIDVYRNFVKEQNPLSMFMHNKSELLVGTTEIIGDCGSHLPTAKEAVVYVWDMNSRKVIHTSTPNPGNESLSGIAMSPEGKMLGMCNRGVFIFDLLTQSYEYPDINNLASHGLFIDNNTFMGSRDGKIFLFDVKTGNVQNIADFKGAGIFERISDNEFLFECEGEIFKLQLSCI